jgi:hypothetical protein
MPIIPPPTATPYDTVSFVLDAARVRMNDEITTLQPTRGQILKSTNEFTQQVCNNGWRKMQDFLGSLGMARFRGEAIISGLPPVQTTDPSVFAYINWFNYFDGANLWAAPVLPADFAYPLWVAERQTGFNTCFAKMESFLDGLPTWPKQTFNRNWEWRDDSIYMPGSTYTMDLQIRYGKFLPDFADAGQVQWFQGYVPIVHCSEALSNYWCAELAEARQDLGVDPKPFREKGEAAAKRLMNRDQSLRQRVNIRRQSRSGRLEGYGGNCGYGGGGGWG